MIKCHKYTQRLKRDKVVSCIEEQVINTLMISLALAHGSYIIDLIEVSNRKWYT